MTFSPDSKYIATGSHTGKVNLIGVESGVKEETLDTRSKFTMSIAYVSLTKIKNIETLFLCYGSCYLASIGVHSRQKLW